MPRPAGARRGEGKPETFTFLGFTHYCAVNSIGRFVVQRKSAAKRVVARLQQIKQELRRRMHEPPALVGEWLKRVVTGFYQYHAVHGDLPTLGRFRYPARPVVAADVMPSQSTAEAKLGAFQPAL